MPILYVYLARSGKTIREVALVNLDDKGNVQPGDSAKSGARGVRIVFTSGEGRPQTLYYFTTNIANDGFRRSGFAAFFESLGVGDSFLKSASYLPHQGGFTQVRDFLLDRSATILQDDSGIPLAPFRRQEMDVSDLRTQRDADRNLSRVSPAEAERTAPEGPGKPPRLRLWLSASPA